MDTKAIESYVRSLNSQLLSRLEAELDVLKESNPDLTDEIDNMFKRLKKGIFDCVGGCCRKISHVENYPNT